jgi:hypothetical protein
VFAAATAAGLVWDPILRPDPAHGWWVAVVALLGILAVAMAAVRPRSRAGIGAPPTSPTGTGSDRGPSTSQLSAAAVVVALVAAVGVYGLGTVNWSVPASVLAAVPALLVAVTALAAALVTAARHGRPAVWLGLVLLAVPALIGATTAAGQAFMRSLTSQGNTAAPVLEAHIVHPVAYLVLSSDLQLAALALITFGLAARRRST